VAYRAPRPTVRASPAPHPKAEMVCPYPRIIPLLENI
jgi:hypothetical protein